MKYSEYLMKIAKQLERYDERSRLFICIQNSEVFRSLYEEAFRMQDVKGIKEVLLYRDNLNSFIYKNCRKKQSFAIWKMETMLVFCITFSALERIVFQLRLSVKKQE